ncbi:MAG TPA: hypothetical protein VGV88_06825 [Candidatus Dormibacteraeota bacterium]|nr:hypothetical protein [Candidatus Dormibacteraeota bacterium]
MEHGISRRRILQVGVLASFAALVSGSFNLVSFLGALMARSDSHLRRSSYTQLVGQSFAVVQDDGERMPLTLIDVRDLARPAISGEGTFALRFEGPAGPYIQHPSLAVEQGELGVFQLAVMPVGRAAARQDYEAIINRRTG